MGKTKELYENIFKISKEIELFLQLENYTKIDALLDKREIFIKQISPEDFTLEETKEIMDQIKILDEKNFEKLKNLRHNAKQDMNFVSKNMKCISMYKVKNTYDTNFVDKRN